ARVSALKRVDLATLGTPAIPIVKATVGKSIGEDPADPGGALSDRSQCQAPLAQWLTWTSVTFSCSSSGCSSARSSLGRSPAHGYLRHSPPPAPKLNRNAPGQRRSPLTTRRAWPISNNSTG